MWVIMEQIGGHGSTVGPQYNLLADFDQGFVVFRHLAAVVGRLLIF